jgi:hypothetical protein
MTITPADPPPILRAIQPADLMSANVPAPIRQAKGELALVAVDIAAFGDPRRDDEVQIHLRKVLYHQLAEAFAMTDLPWERCYREDRGDGALIIAPPDVEPTDMLDPLAHHLSALLRRSNKLASDTARLKLRVAVHRGRIHSDENGVTGRALVHLSRLLDAPALKRTLNASRSDLAMIVSDHLYIEAKAHGGFFNPARYRELAIRLKETRTRGWVWLSHADVMPK